MPLYHRGIDSPIGILILVADEKDALAGVYFRGGEPPRGSAPRPDCAPDAKRQLDEYFSGSRKEFNLELAPRGTEFQLAVWKELLNVPYGETRTYSEIAAAIGRPAAVRAVGAANGANPIPIIVPCHRVIGANGTLTGYGGGLDIKERLLELEGLRLPALF